MVCKKCGAQILPDDQFCPECGVKVIRKRRCPECGELYKVGTKFCPNCGAETGEARQVKKADSGSTSKKRTGAETAPRRKADPAPPPKKKSVYRDEPPRRRRDWDEDDWEEDDWDDDEESVDILTIMTVAVGCILLVVVAVLGFNLYQRYVPKNYERAAEELEEEEEGEEQDADAESGDGQILEEQQEEEVEDTSTEVGGTLVTIADVNIRDNPSTQGTTVIKKAKQGDSYEYIEAVEGGAWYQILLPDEDGYEYGYVSADYIEIP